MLGVRREVEVMQGVGGSFRKVLGGQTGVGDEAGSRGGQAGGEE